MSLATIAPVGRAIILFIALILCCVGTGVKQFKVTGTDYFLYQLKTAGQTKKYKDVKNLVCDKLRSRFDAAYAFAILGCIFIGFALIAVALQFAVASAAKALRGASFAISILAFIFTLISWAIVAGIFNGKFCGSVIKTKDVNGAKLVEGFGLILVSWILLFFDAILAVAGLAAPSA